MHDTPCISSCVRQRRGDFIRAQRRRGARGRGGATTPRMACARLRRALGRRLPRHPRVAHMWNTLWEDAWAAATRPPLLRTPICSSPRLFEMTPPSLAQLANTRVAFVRQQSEDSRQDWQPVELFISSAKACVEGAARPPCVSCQLGVSHFSLDPFRFVLRDCRTVRVIPFCAMCGAPHLRPPTAGVNGCTALRSR